MIENVSSKIKTCALAELALGVLGSLIWGLILMSHAGIVGFVVLAGGIFLSFVSAYCLYGFGQLIENSDEIKFHLLRAGTGYADDAQASESKHESKTGAKNTADKKEYDRAAKFITSLDWKLGCFYKGDSRLNMTYVEEGIRLGYIRRSGDYYYLTDDGQELVEAAKKNQ